MMTTNRQIIAVVDKNVLLHNKVKVVFLLVSLSVIILFQLEVCYDVNDIFVEVLIICFRYV